MNEQEVYKIYKSFSSEMKRWNDKFYPLMEESVAKCRDQAVSELEPIFNRYVWDDAKRRSERLVSPSTEDPCDYDPERNDLERIEKSENGFIVFIKTNTGFGDVFRYTYEKRKKECKLFKREVFIESQNGWRLHHI